VQAYYRQQGYGYGYYRTYGKQHNLYPLLQLGVLVPYTVHLQRGKVGKREVAERRVVYYLGLYDREQYEHYPEHDPHPPGKVFVLVVDGALAAKVEQEHRSREATYEQYYEVVVERPPVVCILGTEQPDLVSDELVDPPLAIRPPEDGHIGPEPKGYGQAGKQCYYQQVFHLEQIKAPIDHYIYPKR